MSLITVKNSKNLAAHLSTTQFVPDCHKTQGMCDKVVSEDSFQLKYCHDKYETQETCNKSVDDFLSGLKLFLICFIPGLLQVKWLKNFLLFYMEIMIYSILMKIQVMSILSYNQMRILSKDLNINVWLLAWHIKFEKCKAFKKELNEELLLIARHPKKWWNFCITENYTWRLDIGEKPL